MIAIESLLSGTERKYSSQKAKRLVLFRASLSTHRYPDSRYFHQSCNKSRDNTALGYFRILLPCLLPSWAAEKAGQAALIFSEWEPLACTDPSPTIGFSFGAMIKTWCFLALLIALPPLFNSLPEHDSDDAPDEEGSDLEGARLLMQVCRLNHSASFHAPCARCQ